MKIEKAIKVAKKNPDDPMNEHIKQLEEEYYERPPPAQTTQKEEIPQQQQQNPNPQQSTVNTGRLPTVFINTSCVDKPKEPIKLTPEVATLLGGHQMNAFCCHWGPLGDFLVTGGDDGNAYIREISDGKQTKQIQLPTFVEGQQNEDRDITAVDVSPDGNLIAVASFDHIVRVFDRNGKILAVLTGHTDTVYCAKFNRSGTLLVTCSAGQSAIIWETQNFARVSTLQRHAQTVVDLSWSGDKIFATASADCLVGIWQIEKGLGSHLLQGHRSQVTGVSWNSDGSLLASSSDDETIRVWNERGMCVVLSGHSGSVNGVKWQPHNPLRFCSYGEDSTLRMWDASTGNALFVVFKHSGGIISLDFNSTGTLIASGDGHGKICVTKSINGSVLYEFVGNDSVNDIKWSPDGRYICACFTKGHVWLIRIQQ
jgi:WD40 repeat protein